MEQQKNTEAPDAMRLADEWEQQADALDLANLSESDASVHADNRTRAIVLRACGFNLRESLRG